MPETALMNASQAENTEELAAWRERVQGTNINEISLLATDYLNHFNEVVMMIEMLPDMPDCLEDIREWRPKSYKEHFADSAFSDKDLAIEAYDHSPNDFRLKLEQTVDQINRLVEISVARSAAALDTGNDDGVRTVTLRASRNLQRLVEVAGAIINGAQPTLGKADVDAMFDD